MPPSWPFSSASSDAGAPLVPKMGVSPGVVATPALVSSVDLELALAEAREPSSLSTDESRFGPPVVLAFLADHAADVRPVLGVPPRASGAVLSRDGVRALPPDEELTYAERVPKPCADISGFR